MLKLHFNFRHLLTLLAIVSFWVVFPAVFTSNSYAANGVARTMNFQGRIVNNTTGINVANGTVKMVFSLYNGASGGTALWTETQNSVPVTDGIFRAVLGGGGTPIPTSVNFNWDGLYLGVAVGNDSEMSPRIQMASVPFAFNAQQVAGLTVLDSAGSVASTSATLKIGTSGSNPITVDLGTQNLTFSTTGTTVLKLPTSGTVLSYLDSATSGTLSSIISSNSQAGSEVGLAINMGTVTSQIQYGLQFNLSGNGTSTNQSYDLYGTAGSWKISNAGDTIVHNLTINGTCSGCGAGGGANYWNLISGANGGYITPINSTADLLIGGQSTASAVFAVLGLASVTHQTTASFSGQLVVMPNNGYGGNASISGTLTLGAFSASSIQTTAYNQLTLGGNTTGKILLSAFGGQTVPLGTTGSIVFSGYNSCTLKTDANGNLQCQTGIASPFAEITGAGGGFVRQTNITEDFLLGGGSTSSAKFAVLNLNSGTPTATIAGNMIIMPYTFGGSELGGFLGIGTANPLATLTDFGTALFQTPIASSAAFQIQNSVGAPVFLVDTTNTTNLLTNPGFETGITGWNIRGTSVMSKNTNKKYIYAGQASLWISTTTANSGVSSNSFTGILGTGTYTLSFNAMLSSGTLTTLNAGYNNGSDVPCSLNNNTVKSTGFQRYSCTFTVPSGTIANIYIDDGVGASPINLFIDAVQLEQNGFASPYTIGAIQLRGVINSPVSIQPESDSTSVFQIQNANGNSNLFVVDSLDNSIGIGTNAPMATLDLRGLGGTTPIASISGSTTFAGLVVDNSIGDLITASASGATRFVVRQNGSVGIGGSLANSGYKLDVLGSARISGNSSNNNDVVKTTTADFTQGIACTGTGYCPMNVSTTGDDVTLNVNNVASVAAPTGGNGLATAISSNSAVFRRPDGKFVILSGTTTGVMNVYDPVKNLFSLGPTLASTLGSGSAVFQRGDGKFMIFYGNRSDIYDPAGTNYFGLISPGPNLPSANNNNTLIAGAGSRVIPRSDGKFLILMGGSLMTGVYDPTANTVVQGPSLVVSGTQAIVASGSAVFERPDGKWVVIMGGGNTSTNIYDPFAGTTGLGAFSVGPNLNGAAGAGANVFQLADGRFMVIDGNNSVNADLYSPTTNSFTAVNTMTDRAGMGSTSFQRPDGTWVVVTGNGSMAYYIYDPTNGANGTFTRGTTFLTNPVGMGGLSFQRDDGMYMIVNGQAGTNSTVVDAGWRTVGSWISEDITNTAISTYSAIFWDSNPQQVLASPAANLQMFVKTASSGLLANSPYIQIQNSGDLIQASGQSTQLKIMVQFNAPVPPLYTQVVGTNASSGMWSSDGSTSYMRYITQPTLFDLKVQNPIAGFGGVIASDSTESRNAATQSATFDGTVTGDSDSVTLASFKLSSSANYGIQIASAAANLGGTAGAGANTIQLANGKFLVVLGGGGKLTSIYNSATGLFSPGPNLTANAGAGSFAIPLPDGRFMEFLGASTATNIYDPVGNVFYVGPVTTAAVGTGAHAIQRSDGRFLILIGNNGTVTNLYDPFLNSFSLGPVVPAAVTTGSFSFKRPDGRYVTVLAAATATYLYEESSNTFFPLASAPAAGGAGGSVIQMANGNFYIIRGGGTATAIYDSRTGNFIAGPSTTGTVAVGSFAIPLPNGMIWLAVGGGGALTGTDFIDPTGYILPVGQAGPALPNGVGPATGTHVFQRSDGKYVVIIGGTASTLLVDTGLVTQGTYITQPINANSLSSSTSVDYKNIGLGSINVRSRTSSSLIGLTTNAWNDVEKDSGYINPNPGDTYAQLRFDFQGPIANNPYEKERVWSGGEAGSNVNYYRPVQAPIMQYWRLTNTTDPNILTLTSENTNAFRFAADGQAYTAAGGAWNSGGADLAERYTSTQDLQAGEVVVGDRSTAQNVVESTTQYQSNIMGVVSTSPGFVAGAYTPDSYPIALVGRVPVKISTENGPIHSGDYLTSSSIPGYAMKATVAGRVLGTALQDFDATDPTQVAACPADGAGSLTTTQCGTITAFINLTNYNGENVELAMADAGFTASPSALTIIDPKTGLDSYMNQVSTGDRNVLSYLESLVNGGSAAFESSEVFTGKVAAGEIISPNIIADLITAKTIRADHIEGLDILTNRISALEANAAVLADATGSAEFATASANLPPALTLDSLNVGGLATISGDLNVSGNSFIQGALNVLSNITTNNLLVSDFAYFINDVVFKGNVRFNGTPTFNNDTAGFAVIKQGSDNVTINFNQEYVNTPVVTASIALDKVGDSVSQKQLEDAILNGNISYVITQRTTKGFIIRLNKPATEDMTFSWVALSVQDAKTSGLDLNVTSVPAATQSAAFQSILNQLNLTPTPTQ
jgi:hypothetical protein